jgi:predicted glycosyl hydrolase (DUF1957 family)
MASMSEDKKQAAEAVEAAAEKTREEAKYRIQPYLSDRKNQFVEQLNQTAGALRETGTHMEDSRSGELIRMSAEKMEKLGGYLGSRDVDELVDDFRSFARTRPWTIMGGAFIAGLAAARFLKAGSR